MSQLDLLFTRYPLDGFQDIWFFDLEPDRAIALYEFAGGERYHDNDQARLEGWDIHCFLAPFMHRGVELSGIAVRIEHQNFAVDFNTGLDYWIDARQHAFIDWLRGLYRYAPEARLTWAHEGCDNRPSLQETALLQRAVGAQPE